MELLDMLRTAQAASDPVNRVTKSSVDLYADDDEDDEEETPKQLPPYSAAQAASHFTDQVSFIRDRKTIRAVVLGCAYSLPDKQFCLLVAELNTTVKAQVVTDGAYLHLDRYTLWTRTRVMDPVNDFKFMRIDLTEQDGGFNQDDRVPLVDVDVPEVGDRAEQIAKW